MHSSYCAVCRPFFVITAAKEAAVVVCVQCAVFCSKYCFKTPGYDIFLVQLINMYILVYRIGRVIQ